MPLDDLQAQSFEANSWPVHNQQVASQQVTAQQGSSKQDPSQQATADHFIVKNGVEFAGTHLIIDLWGASNLDDLNLMEQTMRDAVEKSGATLLHIHLHHFTPNGGISGVAVLAESHISVHTWPERSFAAFDVFMCGDAKPESSIEVLEAAFKPERCDVKDIMRGKTVTPSNDSCAETNIVMNQSLDGIGK